MYLTASNLVHYLLGRGLVTPESVVSGDFLVAEVGRRNRNFKVIRHKDPGLFIKQIGSSEQQAVMTLEREARCYTMAGSSEEYKALADLMPTYVDSDPVQHTLIVELLPGGENITEYHQRLGAFPETIGAMLGKGLGAYHSDIGRMFGGKADMSVFPRQIPWILSFHEYGHSFTNLSAGNAALLQLLRQYPDFQQHMKNLQMGWQYNSLMHGDMKWDNCIVFLNSEGEQDFRIVDWELADFGDSAWDVGSIFQAYLTFWLLSMPLHSDSSPEQLVESANYKLENMQPALQEFWRSYVAVCALEADHARSLLLRCTNYCAARMVQTAYEHLYYAQALSHNARSLLQVSLNILRDPGGAVRDLFGLE